MKIAAKCVLSSKISIIYVIWSTIVIYIHLYTILYVQSGILDPDYIIILYIWVIISDILWHTSFTLYTHIYNIFDYKHAIITVNLPLTRIQSHRHIISKIFLYHINIYGVGGEYLLTHSTTPLISIPTLTFVDSIQFIYYGVHLIPQTMSSYGPKTNNVFCVWTHIH